MQLRDQVVVLSILCHTSCPYLAARGASAFVFEVRHLVLPDEMLREIITPVTDMLTCSVIASPLFKMSVAFIFMANPVSFSFEGLLFSAAHFECTGKWLEIFMDVLGPVRWFLYTFSFLEAERTLESRR